MEASMNKYITRAETLIEALPYIQKFTNKIVVVKYGGSAMIDEDLQKNVIKDVALLKLVGMKPIVVHGGGKEISRWISKVGKEPHFVQGLRVTDAETMEIAEMVLSKVNKGLVQMLEQLGVKAAGISGKDGATLKVEKRYANGEDIGFVGNITGVDLGLIKTLLDNDFIPVVAPIGIDDDFQTYNINADDAACAVAMAIGAEKLAFLTDIEGVYKDPKDSSTLISVLPLDEARELIAGGYIGGGMLPKLTNCIDAVENGVERVHILDGRQQHCLLLEFFTNSGVGTVFTK
ncbi:acetylglutamate kinase [Anaerolentibacter hominis]|uniref:acetylglutamate kinase n=1 Tax=Anaerolentibacter hominis TaxID=3079009 RepID=UPI0031B82395